MVSVPVTELNTFILGWREFHLDCASRRRCQKRGIHIPMLFKRLVNSVHIIILLLASALTGRNWPTSAVFLHGSLSVTSYMTR
jgi:hypothetical protein